MLFELVEGEEVPVEREAPMTAAEEEPREPSASVEPTQADEEAPDEEDAGVSRHGAGTGGRLAALALIAAIVVLGLLALYWGLTR